MSIETSGETDSPSSVKDRLLTTVTRIVSRTNLGKPGFMELCLSEMAQATGMDLGFFLYNTKTVDSLGKLDFWARDDSSAALTYLRSLEADDVQAAILSYAPSFDVLSFSQSEEIPSELEVLREHHRFQRQTKLMLVSLPFDGESYGVMGFVSYRKEATESAPVTETWTQIGKLIASALGRESTRFYHTSALERYKMLVEGLHEGVMLCDEHGVLVHTNRRFAEMLGYSPTEMIGRSSYDFVHSDDRDEMIRRTAERFHLKSDCYESRLRCKDGQYIWVYIQASPWTSADGAVVGSIGAITDITDKKQSDSAIELMLRDTAGDTGDVFFRKLTRNLAKIFNSKYAFVASIDSESDSLCHTVAVWRDGTYIDNSDYPIQESPTEHVLEHGFTVFRDDVAERFPKDSYLPVERIVSYMGCPLLSSKGEKIGVLSIMDDEPIREWETGELIMQVFAQRAGAELERLEAAREHDKLQRQLIQSQKMEAIGTLASGLAHDLNNAMGVVRGHLELIQEQCKKASTSSPDDVEKISNSASSAHSASLQAQDVVAQLLNFAKPKSGEKSVLSIQKVVEETIGLFSTRSVGDSSFEVIDTRDTHNVRADRGQIQQVLTNLFLNALSAMPRGGTITVSYFTTYIKNPAFRNLNAKPGIYLQLAVSDTGVGIPKEYKERLFEPFFSTQPQKSGTGLGLSMAYTIIQEHAGWIEVESEVGKGSTFTIYLPLLPENSNSEVTQAKGSAESSTILVIDDEPAVLDLTVQFLEQFGYETKGFTDPLEAIKWLESSPDNVQLAILDLKMPSMDGKQCLTTLKGIRSDIEVVILSGEVEDSLQDEVVSLGASKFFQKPLEYRLLIDWIEQLHME